MLSCFGEKEIEISRKRLAFCEWGLIWNKLRLIMGLEATCFWIVEFYLQVGCSKVREVWSGTHGKVSPSYTVWPVECESILFDRIKYIWIRYNNQRGSFST